MTDFDRMAPLINIAVNTSKRSNKYLSKKVSELKGLLTMFEEKKSKDKKFAC